MGFKESSDRCGAFDQGAGRPVDGKENSDIVEHAGIAFRLQRPDFTFLRSSARMAAAVDLSHGWHWTA
jgi:hypothetical protein